MRICTGLVLCVARQYDAAPSQRIPCEAHFRFTSVANGGRGQGYQAMKTQQIAWMR